MSEQDLDRRIHEPTPRRRQEFRKRGEIAMSRDVVMVGTVVGAFAGLIWTWGTAGKRLVALLREHLIGLSSGDIGHLWMGVGEALIKTVAPTCAGALVGVIACGVPQLGWPPALKAPKPDFAKLFNPKSIWQIINPKEAGERVLKAVAKTLVVAAAAGMAIYLELQRYMVEPVFGGTALVTRIAAVLVRLVIYGVVALACLGALEYFITRRRLNARMRMTPEEFKRENREQDGDPQIRRRRRMRMRELARRRLNAEVKSADVVLVNPTEYAVALRYRSDESRAPRVVAKGRLQLAERIRELARQNSVPILSRPPLTRLIYKLVPEGREIPSTLFHAVAEILAYVYRLRGRKAPVAKARPKTVRLAGGAA